MLNGLHEKSIEFLKTFKIFFKEENLQSEISIKILLVISLTLNRRIYNFQISQSEVEKSQIKAFQVKLLAHAKKKKDFSCSITKIQALTTISSFNFQNFEERMGAFVKEIVLPYLDHKNPIIRRAAAKAGSLLYVKQKDAVNYSWTRNGMSEIIQKCLGVVMTDRDQQTRLTML